MRVLMTTGAVGGVWTYSLALARGLCSEGWSVTLVVLGPSPDVAQRQDVAAIDGCTLMITDLPLDWTANGDEAVAQAGQTIAELADECDANIIHLNSPALAADVRFNQPVDRKSVVQGKRVSVRVDLGGCRIIKKKKKKTR